MLITIYITIICLLCNYKELNKQVSNIICTYILGIKQFLCISIKAKKVGVVFCIICPHYIKKLPISDKEDNLYKVENIANKKY